jgi:hypothetical protein
VTGQLKEGVDRRFQGPGVSLYLSQEQAALQRGQKGDGQRLGVGGPSTSSSLSGK